MSNPDAKVIQEAERTVYRAKLRLLEEQVLATLNGRSGLALARLWAPSPVIQIVTCDGVHLGRVRRESHRGDPERWFAVPPAPQCPHGPYPTASQAAQSLVGTRFTAPTTSA
ncbi:hypothetical protein ACFHYQ_01120 [Sphaerimonospora cavernae]|uniref:Uncharacterized protein n=1 Tax=Sphaerimonospora cavernae TaxID=1740611 RepID=A0ABV6U176_9ACTN